MPTKKFKMSNGKRGAALAIRVTPRASKNEIVEVLSDQTIKVRLTAPPVEGKANEALVEFLAEVLGVPKSKIEIVAGMNGRDKLVSIVDVDSEEVHKKILANLV
ncbi:MAG: YggU family protein [Anaerolineales bacterium]|nr:YggU family protein [Anaerolineales bacterium]